MRRLAVAVGLVLALAGYAALDVYDVAPGILTLAPEPDPQPVATNPGPTPSAGPQPREASSGMPLATSGTQAPQPTRAGLRAAVGGVLSDSRLGPGLGVAVRDTATGEHLLDVHADDPRIPASTLKLLSAAAVDATFAPAATLTTKVVQGRTPAEVVLVAGGDTLLAPGAGDAGTVAGRAGLGDLVTATVAALRARGTTTVGVGLDLGYAPGPTTAPTWLPAFRPSGITGAVAAIGLSSQRATPGHPGPADPASETAAAFVVGLRAQGITASRVAGQVTAPAGAAVLGSVTSAPVSRQLDLALLESDDALTESLTRQAAFTKGAPPGFAATAASVRDTLAGLGVDLRGVVSVDASGLSRENQVPARVLADVLALGTSGTLPGMRDSLRHLPVAGLSGTLTDRFNDPAEHAAVGTARAKTGTLTGVSAVAGTVVTADGRLLTFVVLANGFGPGAGTLAARGALDRFVAVLAGCGCRK